MNPRYVNGHSNHPGGRLRMLTSIALGLLAVCLPQSASGQAGASGQAALTAADTVAAQPAVAPRSPVSHTTVVSVAIRVPAGSAADPEGTEGTAWILGHSLADQANAALDPAQARVDVTVGRGATVFMLTAVPDAWRPARATLERALFQAPLDEASALEKRDEMEARLAFEGGSPVRDFDRESPGVFAPPGDPWARPTEGTRQSVAAIRGFDIDLFRRNHYRADHAVTAVVGDLAAAASEPAAPSEAAASEPAPPAPTGATSRSGLAWLAGSRVVLTQDVTSTWIAVGFPVDASLPRTAVEMFVHLVTDVLDPQPPDPYRYGLEVEIVSAPGGPVLSIRTAVAPEAADAWEQRILDAVGELRGTVPEGEFFRWSRRRFRAVRLLADDSPGARARRTVEDLVRDGSPRSLDAEIWALTPEDLAAVGRGVGEARVFRLGPDLAQAGGGGR